MKKLEQENEVIFLFEVAVSGLEPSFSDSKSSSFLLKSHSARVLYFEYHISALIENHCIQGRLTAVMKDLEAIQSS